MVFMARLTWRLALSPRLSEWWEASSPAARLSLITYVSAADTAACLAAVGILEESTELVDKLWQNTRYFKAEMQRLGFDLGRSTTPIAPVMLGEATMAQQFSRRLYQEGVFAMALGFPTVPKGMARIRVMNTAAHTTNDLDAATDSG
jgi:glycine C-acetyltransferase